MIRSGSICLSFLSKYLRENKDTLDNKSQKLRCLSETFKNYGGVLRYLLLKQMLDLLSEKIKLLKAAIRLSNLLSEMDDG